METQSNSEKLQTLDTENISIEMPSIEHKPLSTNPIEHTSQKVPLLLKIITWLILLMGIGQAFASIVSIRIFGLSLLLLYTTIVGFCLVALSFGLRKLKVWALNTFIIITILAGIGVLIDFYNNSPDKIASIIGLGLQTLAILYIWRLRKQTKLIS